MILSFDAKHFDKGNKEGASTASLVAFVPGSHQAKHLLHGRDASFRHENFPRVSAVEGLVLNTVDHHCRSLATPDTFKEFHIIENLSARSSLPTTAFEGNHHCRSRLGTPDTFKDIHIIENLTARSSLLATVCKDRSDESRVAGIDAKPHLNSSSGEAAADRTTSIGETGSMVRTIYYYTDAQLLAFFKFNLLHAN